MRFTRWFAMGVAGAVTLLICLGLWFSRRRKSAAERERERRLAVNARGRITDGVLVEPDHGDEQTTSDLLFYRYSAKGLEYSAAQDISALVHLTPPESRTPGVPIQVKYNPKRPSDSIILCEQWSGLPSEARRPAQVQSR